MRLDKYICSSTELTRAQAKRIIGKGEVTVDGQTVKDASMKVSEETQVAYGGRSLTVRGQRYIMLNKPLDTVCSSMDDDMRSVLGLLDLEKLEILQIAGRLDVDTTGLVLITDDGLWSHKITSPKKLCGKRYQVSLAEPVNEKTVEQFAEGIMLRGESKPTKPAKLEVVSPCEALLTLHEGRYHQVKRMFGAINNRVVSLHRDRVGEITLDESLAPGEWRYLTAEEVNSAG